MDAHSFKSLWRSMWGWAEGVSLSFCVLPVVIMPAEFIPPTYKCVSATHFNDVWTYVALSKCLSFTFLYISFSNSVQFSLPICKTNRHQISSELGYVHTAGKSAFFFVVVVFVHIWSVCERLKKKTSMCHFIRGTKSSASAVWTIALHFIWLLCLWHATCVLILHRKKPDAADRDANSRCRLR